MSEEEKKVREDVRKGKSQKKRVNPDIWLEEDGLLLLECWTRDGLTRDQICAKMGISPRLLWKWMNEFPEIKKALKKGRELSNYQVESSLFKVANGFRTTEIKTVIDGQPDPKGNRTVRMEKVEKEFAPNVSAIQTWLFNRCRDKWQRNTDLSIEELEELNNNITIQIVRPGERTEEDYEESGSGRGLKKNKVEEGKISEYAEASYEDEDGYVHEESQSEEEEWLSQDSGW